MILPVAHWTGNNTVNDVIGGNNLTITSPTYTTGKIKTAFAVSSTNTCGEVTGFETLGGTRQYITALAWVKSTSNSTNSLVIAARYDTTNNRQWRMDLNGGSTNDGVFRILLSSSGTSATKDYRGSDDWTDDNWHHVGFTYDNGTVTAYHNGEVYNGMNKSADGAMTSMFNTASKVGVGCNFAAGARTSFFIGSIEDVRIYNQVLTTAQINDIYNNGVGTYVDVQVTNGIRPSKRNGVSIVNIKKVNGIY